MRSTRIPPMGKITTVTRASGRSQRPVWKGVSPRNSCKKSETRNKAPKKLICKTQVIILPLRKLQSLKRRKSSRGDSEVNSTRMKESKLTIPRATNDKTVRKVQPSVLESVIPYSSVPKPVVERRHPGNSKRPG